MSRTKVKGEVVRVPMRDGVRLSVHVHRPEGVGRVPVIVSYTPYRKGALGPHHPIVEHGYATATFDIRGTGSSEGSNDSIYSAPERQDGCDMIEWAATQPWSNGNVGMWGISFGAVVALQMAAAAPPSLKAVIARSGSDDPYSEWTNPGGSPRPYMYLCYAAIMAAANFAPPDPAEVGPAWEKIWRQRLRGNVPWGLAFAAHMQRDAFWRERAIMERTERVRCPVFVVGGWADWYPSALLRIFSRLKCPKRALIGPWSHQWPDHGIPGPRIAWLPEALKWFDRWLKGIKNGIDREPPVTLFVRRYSSPRPVVVEDAGGFRRETEWPLKRARETSFYFRAAGRLERGAPGAAERGCADRLSNDPRAGISTGFYGGGPFNINWVMPLDQRADDRHGTLFTTRPLDRELEVTGVPRLELYVSSEEPAALLFAKLCDVAPDGKAALVTTGCLNLCHRESHARPTTLKAGRIYRVAFDCLACAYRFSRGNRIRVGLYRADIMNVWPTPGTGGVTLYRDAGRASRIVLPVAPGRRPALSPPGFKYLPNQAPADLGLAQCEHAVRLDSIREEASVEYRVLYSQAWDHRAKLTVSAACPGRAEALAESRLEAPCGKKKVAIDSRCATTSDDDAFSHRVKVSIAVDGAPYFAREWKIAARRRCF